MVKLLMNFAKNIFGPSDEFRPEGGDLEWWIIIAWLLMNQVIVSWSANISAFSTLACLGAALVKTSKPASKQIVTHAGGRPVIQILDKT